MSLGDKACFASVSEELKVDRYLAEAICIRKVVEILKVTGKDVDHDAGKD